MMISQPYMPTKRDATLHDVIIWSDGARTEADWLRQKNGLQRGISLLYNIRSVRISLALWHARQRWLCQRNNSSNNSTIRKSNPILNIIRRVEVISKVKQKWNVLQPPRSLNEWGLVSFSRFILFITITYWGGERLDKEDKQDRHQLTYMESIVHVYLIYVQ
jgi:hypothetical protein